MPSEKAGGLGMYLSEPVTCPLRTEKGMSKTAMPWNYIKEGPTLGQGGDEHANRLSMRKNYSRLSDFLGENPILPQKQ